MRRKGEGFGRVAGVGCSCKVLLHDDVTGQHVYYFLLLVIGLSLSS